MFIVRCAVSGYIRPNSMLVVCCGLLAKWLRVWVRVRVRVRAERTGNSLAVLFFSLVL